MIDLLASIYDNKLSFEEADKIFKDTIDGIHKAGDQPDWRITLGISNYEATAYLHGATIQDLFKLRYEGWPNYCCRCGLSLDYKQYGWWYVHSDDGVPRIHHIVCPNDT